MIARIRTSVEESDEGFTLIELLVVIIIIGILAAVAIPVFLNQRKKGYDAAVKSDLHNAAEAEESYFTDKGSYTKLVTPDLQSYGFVTSPATNYSSQPVVKLDGPSSGYCIVATSASGTTWVYASEDGGLQPRGVTACTAKYSL